MEINKWHTQLESKRIDILSFSEQVEGWVYCPVPEELYLHKYGVRISGEFFGIVLARFLFNSWVKGTTPILNYIFVLSIYEEVFYGLFKELLNIYLETKNRSAEEHQALCQGLKKATVILKDLNEDNKEFKNNQQQILKIVFKSVLNTGAKEIVNL